MTRRYGKPMRREPLGVVQRTNRAVMLAQISDPAQRARYEADFPESNLHPLPKKRGPRVEHDDLEKHVLRAVGELLATHPKVLLCVRVNSGAMPYQNAAGKLIPVWFHKILRSPEKVRITDYWGFLTDGRPYCFECKKPSWREPHGERELEQSAYIDLIKSVGGIGAFITNAEQVNALLAQ
jgi:hypothetical protein